VPRPAALVGAGASSNVRDAEAVLGRPRLLTDGDAWETALFDDGDDWRRGPGSVDVFSMGGRRTLAAGVAVSLASAVAPMVLGSGADAARLDLLDGAAWLASESAGDVVRVNGVTGRVDARIDLGDVARDLTVDQARGVVLVSDGAKVRSVDVAKLDWGAAADASGELIVGDDAAYMVSAEGVVREVHPATLETKGEVDLGQAPGRGVVVAGNLVLPLDDGTVAVVDGDEVVEEVDAGGESDLVHVTQVGEEVAVLNASRSELRRLDPRSGDASRARDVEIPEGELAVPRRMPGARLWLVAVRSGELVGINTKTGKARRGEVVPGGHAVTAPVAVDDRVHVVDTTAGEIVSIDASTLGVIRREALGLPNASFVELLAQGGKAFVNDRKGNLAVVIDGDDYRRVDKYTDEGVPSPAPPTDQPDAGAQPSPDPAPPSPASGPAGPPVSVVTPPTPPPTRPPAAPPAPPTAVEAVAGDESATVAWVPGGGGAPTSYRVTYAGRSQPLDVPGDQVSVDVDGLTNGDEYTFEVWAVNDVGESARVSSNAVTPNDEVPGAPTGVRAETTESAAATVSWSEADGRGNDIAGYVVTASPGGATLEVAGEATSADVTGLTNDTAYTFTVTALNDLGNQSEPSAPSEPVTPYGPPAAIPAVRVSEGAGTVGLDWDAAASRTPVTYRVDATPSVPSLPTELTQLSYAATGLTNGVQYTFTITPVNDRGDGPAQQVTATPGTQPTINNVSAERTDDRRFTVSFSVDDGGRPITECWVTGGPQRVDCTVQNGSASAAVSVNQYAQSYTFTPHVTSSLGTADGPAVNASSAGKPLVVLADTARWDGSCTWRESPGTRPYFSSPNPGNNNCGVAQGYIPNGNTVRAECWTTGYNARDDNLVYSNRWVRMGQGYMNTLYFDGYRNPDAMLDGLAQC
jgi:Fibronectin type III domain